MNNLAKAGLIALGLLTVSAGPAYADEVASSCESRVAQWLQPDGAEIAPSRLFDGVADKPIVLLGEAHDNPAHHRWQLHTLAALHSRNANLVLGLEMLPRSVQPVLDDWSAGKLDEADFLERSGWDEVWGYDAGLYLPLLHFARMNRIPAVAINIDRELVSKVGQRGWRSLAESERMGLSDPAPASDGYRRSLAEVYAYKQRSREHGEHTGDEENLEKILQDEEFANFVDAQLTWDRAMAEALAAAHRGDPAAQVVAIVGRGHLEYGHGIPHQLRDLGITDAVLFLPHNADESCDALPEDLADAVFVVDAQPQAQPPPRPRLGVMIENGDNGVRVLEVVDDSVAARAGIRVGDLIRMAAGFEVTTTRQLIDVIQRQAPGTWLPIELLRDDEARDLVARFPQHFN